MIAPLQKTDRPSILRVGDEPAALARARLLFEITSPPPSPDFPRKGVVRPVTTLDGENSEWLVGRCSSSARGRIPPDRDWLRALAEEEAGGALGEIAVLLASARRSAAHDLRWAFDALARSPEEVRRDERLIAFREECRRATGAALRARPRFAWRVALVTIRSAESVEDIVAARWRNSLGRYLVLAANPAYAAGRVTYAFKTRARLDPAVILPSALPEGAEPPAYDPDGAGGRGSLPTGAFEEMLRRLRFRGKEVGRG